MTGSNQPAATPGRVVHVFFQWTAAGGVEVILKEHSHTRGEMIVGTREPQGGKNLLAGLGMRGWLPLAILRSRFRKAVPEGSVIIYHNGHCASLFSGIDGASTRLFMLHGPQPGLGKHYAAVKGGFHAALVVSRYLLDDPELDCAGIPHGFRFLVTLPAGLGGSPPTPNLETFNPKLRLGYIGRMVRDQKRLDRLPELAAWMDARAIEAEINLYGDGPLKGALPDQVGRIRIVKHGYLEKAELAAEIVKLDATFSLTDYEGFGLNVIDSLAAGVPIFFPDLPTDALDHVRQAADWLVYPKGDMTALGTAIARLASLDPQARKDLRQRSLASVAGRTRAHYFSEFDHAIATAAENPAVRVPPRLRRLSWLPMKLVWKLLPIS